MRTSQQIFKNAENTAKRKNVMTFEQLQCIILLSDELGRFDEAIKWLTERDFATNRIEANNYIDTLSEEIDSKEPESTENAHIAHLENIFNSPETY